MYNNTLINDIIVNFLMTMLGMEYYCFAYVMLAAGKRKSYAMITISNGYFETKNEKRHTFE